VVLSVLSLLICGIFFPLLITGIAQATMPYQADGSLAHLPNGRVAGSYLIDNNFTAPVFFQGRNESNPLNASASGVDPDITTVQAEAQVQRISNWTGVSQNFLFNLISSNTEGTFWIFGNPYVNVLKLNLLLIQAFPQIYQKYVAAA